MAQESHEEHEDYAHVDSNAHAGQFMLIRLKSDAPKTQWTADSLRNRLGLANKFTDVPVVNRAIEAMVSSPLLFEGMPFPRLSSAPKSLVRIRYTCTRCGKPKRNHICKFVAPPTVDMDRARLLHPQSFQRGQKRTRDESNHPEVHHNRSHDTRESQVSEEDNEDEGSVDGLYTKRIRRPNYVYKPLKVLLLETYSSELQEILDHIHTVVKEENVLVRLKIQKIEDTFAVVAEATWPNSPFGDKPIFIGQLSDVYRDLVKTAVEDGTIQSVILAPMERVEGPGRLYWIAQLYIVRSKSWNTKRLNELEYIAKLKNRLPPPAPPVPPPDFFQSLQNIQNQPDSTFDGHAEVMNSDPSEQRNAPAHISLLSTTQSLLSSAPSAASSVPNAPSSSANAATFASSSLFPSPFSSTITTPSAQSQLLPASRVDSGAPFPLSPSPSFVSVPSNLLDRSSLFASLARTTSSSDSSLRAAPVVSFPKYQPPRNIESEKD